MDQLEKRFYNLDELAELTGVNRRANNFKRDVENILDNWGYGHDWINRRGATIKHIPETPEEKLQEILIRQFHVDIQTDMYGFSCFVTAFSEIEGFNSMPWGVRETAITSYFGIYVDERKQRKWCKKLFDQELISKSSYGSYWKTEIKDNVKIRTPLKTEKDYQDYDNYYKRRSQLLDECTKNYLHYNPSLTIIQARNEAWKDVYTFLWAEFHCCYYSCKDIQFKAWVVQGDIEEIIELTNEIAKRRNKHG